MSLVRRLSGNGRVMVFGVVLVCALCTGAFGQPWDGNGVEGDPYQIWDANDMQAIGADSNYWDSHFLLCADINLAGYTGTSFNIIGTDWENAFAGVFDGNGHTISNFTYDSAGSSFIGMFGRMSGPNAEIKNLGLIDPNVDVGTGNAVGALVGYTAGNYLDTCKISNCYVKGGSVSGNDRVGGLVGVKNSGTISDCYVEGTKVSGSGEDVGGLVGNNGYQTISTCYSTGSVSGNKYVGGLVGYNVEADITDSYSTASVIGDNYVGGLTGSAGWLRNCYSAGSVDGNNNVGGLAGRGLGQAYSFHCYWDVNTSGQLNSPTGTGKTTAEMQDPNTYLGWGCGSVWKIFGGDEGADYPRLWWEDKPGEIITNPTYGGGRGTKSEPYLIYTAEELNTIGLIPCHLSKHFKLMNDIDLEGFSETNFNIIGAYLYCSFTGNFDGNGCEILNFTYSATRNSIGLFGIVGDFLGDGGEIKDLGLIDPIVDAGTGDRVGALVGSKLAGSISNCYVKGGSVSGDRYVGGLVGENSGTISNCSFSASVSGNYDVGGLVGDHHGNISKCYTMGIVEGATNVGGLIGERWAGTITQCYSTSYISGNQKVGGLVGDSSVGQTISNCYSTGSVEGVSIVGGLVGINSGPVTKCYSVGLVSGSSAFGGLVGENGNPLRIGGPITDSFWDTDTSGVSNMCGGQDSGGTGCNDDNAKTTAEMQTESTFTDAGWDFAGEVINGSNDIWEICEGTNYPKFVWQIPVGDLVCPDGVNFEDYAYFAEWWYETDYGDVNGVELTGDGKVNWEDFGLFAGWWMVSGCGECGGADFTGEGAVDELDLDVLAGYWLESEYGDCGGAELTGDGMVGADDLREFSEHWLAGL